MKTYVTLLKPQQEEDGMLEIYKNQISMSNTDMYPQFDFMENLINNFEPYWLCRLIEQHVYDVDVDDILILELLNVNKYDNIKEKFNTIYEYYKTHDIEDTSGFDILITTVDDNNVTRGVIAKGCIPIHEFPDSKDIKPKYSYEIEDGIPYITTKSYDQLIQLRFKCKYVTSYKGKDVNNIINDCRIINGLHGIYKEIIRDYICKSKYSPGNN